MQIKYIFTFMYNTKAKFGWFPKIGYIKFVYSLKILQLNVHLVSLLYNTWIVYNLHNILMKF